MDEAFPDNWSYLRTELAWLDRVLAGAIARQRQETKEISRVSKARIDQITSHWWKGLIQVDRAIAGDSPAEVPRRSGTQVNYQQQLEAKIQATQRQGIVLGLPSLCQRLDLSLFEKNLILLALAPEVSRRYGRIYNFLQDTDHPGASGLPTIDLMLRLLCRNDPEWRTARLSLSNHAKLLRHRVVVLPQSATEPFLAHPVKLADAIAEYLLADVPQLATLELLLSPLAEAEPPAHLGILPETWNPEQVSPDQPILSTAIAQWVPTSEDLWQTLILPKPLEAELRHVCDRVRYAQWVDENWEFESPSALPTSCCGTVALLMGPSGTGKTLAAQAIAQSLKVPLVSVDLALLELSQMEFALQHLTNQAPTVLLLKSAKYWFGRSPVLSSHATKLRQFLHQRGSSRTITLLSATQPSDIKASWRANLTTTLIFPRPTQINRLQLWRQAFPAATPLTQDIDWQELAKLPFTGGQIRAIAREAAIYALAETATINGQQAENHINRCEATPEPTDVNPTIEIVPGKVSMQHLLQACQMWNTTTKRPSC
ncbi:MAG: ATP-binding protein [Leptolyngbyaceae cyanobacterium bins.349]|nr:ATP-binding protein [Leptolyngbyaceae cyanobacterium bins.349]